MYLKIQLIGRLGKDPESRFTPSGQQVTSFSVATDHKYTNNAGEKVKETTWLRVSVWGNLAQSCSEYLRKGSLVYIEGRLTPDKATGGPRIWSKPDGSAGSSFEVNAQTVRFLSARGEGGAEAAHEAADIPEDEVPF